MQPTFVGASYMEALAPEFKNASTWEGIGVTNPWTSYEMMLQPIGDGYTKARFSFLRGKSFTQLNVLYKIAPKVLRLQVY